MTEDKFANQRARIIVFTILLLNVVLILTLTSCNNNTSTMTGSPSSTSSSSEASSGGASSGVSNVDTSRFRSDTRYGDYYYVKRDNMEIIINCKTKQVLTRDLTTKEVVDASALAVSMGVDWKEVCR